MNELRRLIHIVETMQSVNEIQIGGQVDGGTMADLEQTDFATRQRDLFPELPTLEPELPQGYERMGRIGSYVVIRRQERTTKDGKPEFLYVLIDRGRAFGYACVIDRWTPFGGGYRIINPPIGGHGLRVISVFIDQAHAGQGMAVKLYEWLLTHVCDYLLPDEVQTPGGVAIWRKLLNSRRFEVMVYDQKREVIRRRRPGKDFAQVYNTSLLIPFVTLAGRADDLISDDQSDVRLGDGVADDDEDGDDAPARPFPAKHLTR